VRERRASRERRGGERRGDGERGGVLLPEPLEPSTCFFLASGGVRPRGRGGGEAMAAAIPAHLAPMPLVRPWATMYGVGNKGSRRDTEKTARTHTHELMETVNAENFVLLNEPQLFVVFFSFYLTNMQSSGDARTTRARRVHPHVRGVRAPLGAQVVRELISLSTTSYLRGHHNSALAHATEAKKKRAVQCLFTVCSYMAYVC